MDCGFYAEDIALGTGTKDVPGLAGHLAACTSCSELSREFSAIQSDLINFPQPEIPSALVASVKRSIATELAANGFDANAESALASLIRQWLLPYSVATATSVVVIGSFLWLMISGTGITPEGFVAAPSENDARDVVMIDPSVDPGTLNQSKVTGKELATNRSAVSMFSPSINPDGSLMELAGSLAQGRIRGDELVIVANVLNDGSAELEEIVEPLDDRTISFEVGQALNGKGADAPFLPAFVDNRPEQTKVVFKLQRVDIKVNAGGSR